jgi:hypothetical protein
MSVPNIPVFVGVFVMVLIVHVVIVPQIRRAGRQRLGMLRVVLFVIFFHG